MKKILLFILAFGLCHANKADYWQVQKKGANFFNQTPTEDWFVAAKKVGIQFARLAPDKWKSSGRDFLLGNADDFSKICPADFQMLKNTLDQADKHGVKIVITLLSLPGSRWKQNNNDQDDLRLWQSKVFQAEAILFWKQLAHLLKDHPAVVGYNILNEPHPEQLFGFGDFREIDFKKWNQSIQNSPADLNLFYRNIVKAIREVDTETPIILDTGLYATPWAISYLTPLNDPHVIYSFHMYEPYAYTTRKINKERYEYPGRVDTEWNKGALEEFLEPVSAWQEKFQIPSSQIIVGEFGCDRTSKGADRYLGDLIRIFNSKRWHWAFYSFREDCWDSMDYELGTNKLNWDVLEQNSIDSFRHDNPLFDVIKDGFR